MKIVYIFFALFVLFFETGCVRLHMPKQPRSAKPLPMWLVDRLSYEQTPVSELIEDKNISRGNYLVKSVKLSDSGSNTNFVSFDWYLPKGDQGQLPVIVILPISSGKTYPLESHNAGYFARHNFSVITIHREPNINFASVEEINSLLKQSIISCRRVFDWIETKKELDKEKIAVLGTSLGGIKGALVVAVEPRVKAAVLCLSGGDIPHIIAHTTDGLFKGGGIVGNRKTYLKKTGATLSRFEQELREGIIWNPNDLAVAISPEKILLFSGFCDSVVPYQTAKSMREAMGKPETEVMLASHYSSLVYIWHIESKARAFIEKRFDEVK